MAFTEQGTRPYTHDLHAAGNLPSGGVPLHVGRTRIGTLIDVPWAAFLQQALTPTVVGGTLVVCALAIEGGVSMLYVSLALFTAVLSAYVVSEFPLTHTQAGLLLPGSRRLFVQWFKLVAIILFIGFATKTSNLYSRKVLLTWILLTPFTLLLAQEAARSVLRRAFQSMDAKRRKVVVGANRIAYELARRIDADPLRGTVVGFFDDRAPERLADVFSHKLLGRLTDLSAYVRNNRVDAIYIALPTLAQQRVRDLLSDLEDSTVSVYYVPDLNSFQPIQTHVDDIDGILAVSIRDTPFRGVDSLIKRISDIVLASLILALIWPVLLVLAAAVKLSSPGPVLFRQRRYGTDGREIVVYKFRSMTVCEDGDQVTQAQRNDKRVTPLGKIMRATSLDELPQFLNVLQGRMSVVGPRPHAVSHNEQYRKLIPGYMLRHKVKPGITGWAQVNGLRGETDDVDKMKARIHYDLDYLRNWSLGLDLWIVVKTAFGGFFGRGAY